MEVFGNDVTLLLTEVVLLVEQVLHAEECKLVLKFGCDLLCRQIKPAFASSVSFLEGNCENGDCTET